MPVVISNKGPQPLIFPRTTSGLQIMWYRKMKTAYEWPITFILLLGLLPVMLVIAILVRRDGGPAFFIQSREGLHGRPIRILKFRTLHTSDCNPHARSSTDINAATITDFGTVLRQTGLDELPQLFNILKGDMSLVGPRPHVPEMEVGGQNYVDIVPNYSRRLEARPGITGLAQVQGWCGPVKTAEHAHARIASDCFYIENWSPWLDLKILVATAVRLVRMLGNRRWAAQ